MAPGRKELKGAAATWKEEVENLPTFKNIPWEEGQAGTGSD